ncbi:MAG TPA: SDR family oxidoreductase [Candidatus Omnitrophota bacterium]|nr:SDR family oxidoreductase [Candidatus Omnitrophota bacterium]HPD85515.1 SDR family oxidoreductase [Candidatus Omnitrophota bacterium]HRZ04445.1 SDR family oxidoreductase [Candidatus Omnitrophota bacterium]
MSNLKGKCAIITGASRGIGKAVAVRLAQAGVNLVLAARTKETLDETAKELSSKYKVKVIGVPTDVSKLDDLKNLVDTAIKEFKNIDILINNAGVSSQYPFEKQPLEDIEKLAHTNYLGYVRLIRLVINHMIERKEGAIINMVSGSTLCDPLPKTFLTYSSLKVGLRAFLKGLFWEMRDRGIKITSILPGVVDSDLTDHLANITQEQKERLMSPETVADMVMFALSVPANSCPLELAVINQQTPWTKPVIDYDQKMAK